jgi:hypothetical protein
MPGLSDSVTCSVGGVFSCFGGAMGDVCSCFDRSVAGIRRRGTHIRRGTRRRAGMQDQGHGEGHKEVTFHRFFSRYLSFARCVGLRFSL